MEKDNNQNELGLSTGKIFPNLRKTYSVAKNLITLSKVELDKNLQTIQPPQSRQNVRQISTSFSHKRITSGFNAKQFVHTHLSRTYRNFYQPIQKNKIATILKQKSSSISTINSQHTHPHTHTHTLNPHPHPQPHPHSQPQKQKHPHKQNPQTIKIQKSKISTKPLGTVKGYSVNSHPGCMNLVNEDRICVITNLNKSGVGGRDQCISFFSVYDGNNGIRKAEYFRDHFHGVFTRDREFFKDVEMAIKRTVMIVQNDFEKDQQQDRTSTLTFTMTIIIGTQIYIASMGDQKLTVSYNHGSQIHNPFQLPHPKPKPSTSFSVSTHSRTRTHPVKNQIHFHKLQAPQSVDFLVLGSEGLYQNFGEKQISTLVWRQLIGRTEQNLHVALGECNNTVMREVFKQISTKNVSIVIIAFENVEKCFESEGGSERESGLLLPFINLKVLDGRDKEKDKDDF